MTTHYTVKLTKTSERITGAYKPGHFPRKFRYLGEAEMEVRLIRDLGGDAEVIPSRTARRPQKG